MTTSTTTLKSIAAAATVGIVVACGAAPQSEISSDDAGEPADSQTTSTPDTSDEGVPWGDLPDEDRIERTHTAPAAGCITVDTMLPC